MMSSNTMRTATENANMTGSMSGAAAEKHMPDATGPSQPANAEASVLPLAVVPAARTVVPSSLCSAR